MEVLIPASASEVTMDEEITISSKNAALIVEDEENNAEAPPGEESVEMDVDDTLASRTSVPLSPSRDIASVVQQSS